MSLIDFLNDLTVDESAKAYADELRFSFAIAEQCEDPNDVAESALWLVARKVEADAKRLRDLAAQAERSARLYGTGDSARIEYARSAAELEALAARIRAALKPVPPLKEAA